MTTFPETNEFLQTLSAELGVSEQHGYPWMPLPKEDAQAYMAFELWRGLGPRRPLQQHLMAVQHHWGARALAYDTWVAAQHQDVRQMADQIGKTILKSSEMAMEAIQIELIKQLRNMSSTGANSMTLTELINSMEKIAKTSRLLSDQSTDNVAVVVGQTDLTKLSLEELDEVERLQKKASTALPG